MTNTQIQDISTTSNILDWKDGFNQNLLKSEYLITVSVKIGLILLSDGSNRFSVSNPDELLELSRTAIGDLYFTNYGIKLIRFQNTHFTDHYTQRSPFSPPSGLPFPMGSMEGQHVYNQSIMRNIKIDSSALPKEIFNTNVLMIIDSQNKSIALIDQLFNIYKVNILDTNAYFSSVYKQLPLFGIQGKLIDDMFIYQAQ